MDEPSPRSSRLALAGVLAATIVLGGAGFLLGRATAEPERIAASPPAAAPAPTPTPTAEPVRGLLGRAELIALAAAAADAAAAGRGPGPELVEADGRRFELRLPFGCDGPAAEGSNAAMRWHYDAGEEALRLHVDPVVWTGKDWGRAEAAGAEALEGFWIARPWTASEACPVKGDQAAAAGAEPVTLPGQTLAVTQIFSGAARSGDRNIGPYQATIRMAEADLNAAEGFRLRISGRVAAARGAGPVQCLQPAGPEQRPICRINVVMDEVAIENPVSGTVLATWSLAGRSQPDA